jgi:hypothetical protein
VQQPLELALVAPLDNVTLERCGDVLRQFVVDLEGDLVHQSLPERPTAPSASGRHRSLSSRTRARTALDLERRLDLLPEDAKCRTNVCPPSMD